MASSASKMSESKVKLKEAEDDPKKQMEMLESSSMPQAIAVFSLYGEAETVGSIVNATCPAYRYTWTHQRIHRE